jgi:hypothetical protein
LNLIYAKIPLKSVAQSHTKLFLPSYNYKNVHKEIT